MCDALPCLGNDNIVFSLNGITCMNGLNSARMVFFWRKCFFKLNFIFYIRNEIKFKVRRCINMEIGALSIFA